jgi:hypothetical protein
MKMNSNEKLAERHVLPDRRIRRRRTRSYKDTELPMAGIFAIIVVSILATASVMGFLSWYSRAVCAM